MSERGRKVTLLGLLGHACLGLVGGVVALAVADAKHGLPHGPKRLTFIAAVLVWGPFVMVLRALILSTMPPKDAPSRPPGPAARELTPMELLRQRLQPAEAGPGRTADEQVVRGRLDGARVAVRVRQPLGREYLDQATCSVEAAIPRELRGVLAPGRCGAADPALLAGCGEVRATATGLETTTRRTDVDALVGLLRKLVAVAAVLRTDAVVAPEPPTRSPDAPPLSVRAGAAAQCPYCRSALLPDDGDVVACARCGTGHHVACFHEHRGCTVLGCEETRARPLREPT